MEIFSKALIALLVERAAGYPQAVLQAIGHPVQWQGALIDRLDMELNTRPHDPVQGKLRGLAALAALLAFSVIPAWLIARLCVGLPLGGVVEALVATSFIAQKSLHDHVRDVDRALSVSVETGRRAVAKIVGRNTAELDESGISRAALESLAENTADGIVAPLFWYLLGGLPGLAAYKAVNTADSMIGHKSEQHLNFGFAAARLDDLLNLVPARVTALIFSVAAALSDRRQAHAALVAAWRDAGKHRSPNAGWPEAAMAGALGLRFGGPRAYDGETVDLPWMGDGREGLTRADIGTGLTLYARSLAILWGLTAVAALAL
jgi:adenosylcobinamide-phosphate synthase